MQHVHDTDIDPERITRDEVAELVACALERFEEINRRLDAYEALLNQRAEAMLALSVAFDGVCASLKRLSAES